MQATHENKGAQWAHYETFSEGMRWPEGQALPSFSQPEEPLRGVSLLPLSDDARLTLAALQGLVNRKKTRLYLYGDHALQEGLETWPQRLGLRVEEERDLFALIGRFAPELAGVVLYDCRFSPHYRNLACTVAGIQNLLPVESRLFAAFAANGVNLPVACDLRGLSYRTPVDIYRYLYDTYWKDCTRRVFVSLSPTGHCHFTRDMAAAVGAAVVWLDPRIAEEKQMLDLFLQDLTAGQSIILGWWPEERSGIGEGTRYGVSTIPSDFYENSTVHAAMPHVMHIPAVPKKPRLENKIYLALFFSDGDNVQYCQHRMSELWGNKDRGTVPLNWTVSPGLADIGPGILNYFYDTATQNDCFASGPSGLGYALIYDEHNKVLFLQDESLCEAYTAFSNRYLTKDGIRSVTVWDQLREMHYRAYEKNCRALYGLTLEDWFQDPAPLQLHVENQRLAFMPNYPAYAEDTDDIYNSLCDVIRDFDGSKPLFLAAQGVTWSLTSANIKSLKERFDALQPGKIEVLRADHFFSLLNEAKGLPFNLALSPDLKVTVNDEACPCCVVDGSPYGEHQWTAQQPGGKCFTFDLGGEYTLSRYVVKHAGANSVDAGYNNRDFSLQLSADGEHWQTVDQRAGNCDDLTDVDFTPVRARYARLDVTAGGCDGLVRVADFELYGSC